MNERLKKIVRAEYGFTRKVPIVVAILCWTAAVLFVKYFSRLMDVHTQNFFRYFGAALFLGLVVRKAYPGSFRRYLSRWKLYLLLGGMIVGFQVCWVHSLYRLDPALVSLLGNLSTLLITLAAFVFYRDEREVIGSGRFLAGFTMGMIGVAGVVTGISNFKAGLLEVQKEGIALAIVSSVIWAVYINLVKRVLRTENSLCAFTFTCISAAAFFFPLMMILGQPLELLAGPPGLIGLVILSGIIGIAGANSTYFLSIKRIGMAPSANLVLLNPFLVAAASYLIFGEKLTAVQWIFGVILVAGCFLVISVRQRD